MTSAMIKPMLAHTIKKHCLINWEEEISCEKISQTQDTILHNNMRPKALAPYSEPSYEKEHLYLCG